MTGNGLYFSPETPITRAQVAAVISRIYSLEAPIVEKPSYIDVPKNHWAFNNFEALRQENLMNGVSEELFSPNKEMSRTEMAILIARMLNKVPSITEMPFTDINSNHPYMNAILVVNELGIFTGDENGKFNPDKPLTRAEFATIVQRLLPLIDGEEEQEEPINEVDKVEPTEELEQNNA